MRRVGVRTCEVGTCVRFANLLPSSQLLLIGLKCFCFPAERRLHSGPSASVRVSASQSFSVKSWKEDELTLTHLFRQQEAESKAAASPQAKVHVQPRRTLLHRSVMWTNPTQRELHLFKIKRNKGASFLICWVFVARGRRFDSL